MALTTYLTIPPELEEKYYKALQSGERFILPRIRPKTVILSRERIAGLTRKSYLPAIAILWHAFTDEQKAVWKAVSPYPRKHGWCSFVADQCKRIKFGIPGTATPDEFHQNNIGRLLIESPAEELKIIQPHPASYWVSKKVKGTKSMYEPVVVEEHLSLPFKITISRKSNLVSTGEGSFVRFYASIRHMYQGQNLNHDEIIEIPLVSDWAKQESIVSALAGTVAAYSLYFHLYKVRGTLEIDLVKAEHSGSNWARDTYCKKIEQDFTRGFYQVPKHWAPITMPAGTDYESVYPT